MLRCTVQLLSLVSQPTVGPHKIQIKVIIVVLLQLYSRKTQDTVYKGDYV